MPVFLLLQAAQLAGALPYGMPPTLEQTAMTVRNVPRCVLPVGPAPDRAAGEAVSLADLIAQSMRRTASLYPNPECEKGAIK